MAGHPVPAVPANPVRPLHIILMADRIGDAAQDRLVAIDSGTDSARYRQAVRIHERRRLALQRMVAALERQAGGDRR